MSDSIQNETSRAPSVRELRDAPEPHEALRRFADCPWVLLLDSAAHESVQGRYSYLAAHPFRTILATGARVVIEESRTERLSDRRYSVVASHESQDPFEVLKSELSKYRTAVIPDLPPFQGGAAGLFGYGLCRVVEEIPPNAFNEFRAPDLVVGLYDWVLAWDHEEGTCHLFYSPLRAESSQRDPEALAVSRADAVVARLAGPPCESADVLSRSKRDLRREELAPSFGVPNRSDLLSNFTKDDYVRAVARSIEYVHAGDIFQVNLSQRLLAPQKTGALEFYSALRRNNPAPFAAYFDFGEFVVASSSPEQFLGLRGDEVVTRPIKGTRSRGYTAEEEIYRRLDLSESEKDRAENVMIVDLLRNDLSRVCRPRTVTVPRLFDVERHPTVHHLVSEVRGSLREGFGALDLLRSSFPGGSITGAPKVRAMEIIAELEPTERGYYCGSLAWISFHGDMGSSILIRTVTIGRGWLQIPVGGGIVADSSPDAEYQETLDKAAGMVRALS